MSIGIVKPGLLTTLQDAGRPGFAHLGIGRAGAFDAPALRIANALCGNAAGACGLEITLLGPTLRFHHDAWIAVTGAPIPLRVDGREAQTWAPVLVPAGSSVELGAMRHGCRAYLAIHGGFAIQPVLGSRGTDVNAHLGPFDGRPLRAGDTLETRKPGSESVFERMRNQSPGGEKVASAPLFSWRLDPRPWCDEGPVPPLRLILGTHFENLEETSRISLFSKLFQVHADSNRVGLRLTGPGLEWQDPVEMVSEGCVPGLLQLPPSGQPIVFGPECPTSGGYPRIGQVAAVDLPRLAQRQPGDAVRFRACTFEDALEALRTQEHALREIERLVRQRLKLDSGFGRDGPAPAPE